MKTFEQRKQHTLTKMREADKSKKGSVDKAVIPLLDIINQQPKYYSTSSCAGRILLLHEPDSRKKNQYEWPYVTHDQATYQPVLEATKKLEGSTGRVWLRMQTVIIHIACSDLQAAKFLLSKFHAHGWKRSGIFSVENDIMVELLSVESMEIPIINQGKLLVSEEFIKYAIDVANEKLIICHQKIEDARNRLFLTFEQTNNNSCDKDDCDCSS